MGTKPLKALSEYRASNRGSKGSRKEARGPVLITLALLRKMGSDVNRVGRA